MGHCYFKTNFVVFSAELSLTSPGLTRMARVFQFFWDNLLDRVKRMIHWRDKEREGNDSSANISEIRIRL